MRKNVWLFDFRMTVYYQAHSSGGLIDTTRKCPNIMKGMLTVAY